MTSKTSSFIGATGPPSQAMRKLRRAQLVGPTLLTVFLAAGISITIGCRPIIGAKAWRLTEYLLFAAVAGNPRHTSLCSSRTLFTAASETQRGPPGSDGRRDRTLAPKLIARTQERRKDRDCSR